MKRIVATAPNRIDLGGGTLDIPPLSQILAGSLTVNLAIAIPSEAEIAGSDGPFRFRSDDLDREVELEDLGAAEVEPGFELILEAVRALGPPGPVDVRTSCRAPRGSGLGASSALTICILGAMAHYLGRPRTMADLIRIAAAVEIRVLGVPTGQQDHHAAALGGALALHWWPSGIRVERLPLSTGFQARLEESILLSYTGAPHSSGETNWGVVRAAVDGKRRTRAALEDIREIAVKIRDAFLSEDVRRIGRLIGQDARCRKKLSADVVPTEIGRVMEEARLAGALGSRLSGAGGGGCLVTFVEPDQKADVQKVLSDGGFLPLRWSLSRTGMRIGVR
jgi:D-glycero-alpha-D-manno-heptose-7-phosphate kinase